MWLFGSAVEMSIVEKVAKEEDRYLGRSLAQNQEDQAGFIHQLDPVEVVCIPGAVITYLETWGML